MYDGKEGIIVAAYDPSELRFCLSGSDALTLLEFIQKSLNCDTKDDYKALFPKIRELIPFDYAYSLLAHHDDKNELALDFYANISFPIGWLEEYQTKNTSWGMSRYRKTSGHSMSSTGM